MNPEKSGFTRPVQNLRDELAIERTILANERSLLAYLRTTLAFIAISFSLFFFEENPTMWLLAIIFLSSAGVIVVLGVRRYLKVQKIMYQIKSSDK